MDSIFPPIVINPRGKLQSVNLLEIIRKLNQEEMRNVLRKNAVRNAKKQKRLAQRRRREHLNNTTTNSVM